MRKSYNTAFKLKAALEGAEELFVRPNKKKKRETEKE
jgi:hypothetical protein